MLRWSFCEGRKEGYNANLANCTRLTAAALAGCLARGERLTHLKPEHVARQTTTTAGGATATATATATAGTGSGHHSAAAAAAAAVLNTPERFFGAAKRAGWRVVVGIFRENQLARLVSSFELLHARRPLEGAALEGARAGRRSFVTRWARPHAAAGRGDDGYAQWWRKRDALVV